MLLEQMEMVCSGIGELILVQHLEARMVSANWRNSDQVEPDFVTVQPAVQLISPGEVAAREEVVQVMALQLMVLVS